MRLRGVMAFSILAVVCALAAGIDDGLVAHWKFDEGRGLYAYDCVANRSARLGGADWAKGAFGTAVQLGGDGKNVVLRMPEALRSTDEMSVSLWVMWDDVAGQYPNVFTAGWNPGGIMFFMSDGNLSFRVGRPGETWYDVSKGYAQSGWA
ncbi:MAG: hypothetical protein J5833_02205, partial [Victivallales bacterium]|nr:hypothetical protein [Victivallales bacterium]